MKVAIVQNQVGIDGRSRVIGEIVAALNELDTTPDVYTLSTGEQRRSWLEVLMEGRELRCQFPEQPRLPLRRGYAYRTILHNWLLRKSLRSYDLIVNSNDFIGFLPTSVRRVHYFHFPLRASFSVMTRYQHPAPRLVALAAKWGANHFDADISPDDVTLANSRYTRDRVVQLWPDASVNILYPPVDVPPTVPSSYRDIDVVTLGSIAPEKHQLEQIEIAVAMPKRRFAILGVVRSSAYARKVERAVREKGLTNVTLAFNANARRMKHYLSRAQVYLDMSESEHFGISVAQAISYGCVPVVHDSGAQAELVTEPTLRFNSHGDLPRILRDVLAGRVPEPGYVAELRSRVRDLAPEHFRARIKEVLV